MPALFAPNVTDNVPDGLNIDETIACLTKRSTKIIDLNVENEADHIFIGNRTPVGHSQLIQSVTPLDVNTEEANHQDNKDSKQKQTHSSNPKKIPKVTLDGVRKEQKDIAKKMPEEESLSFSENDSDIGHICKMIFRCM